MKKKLKLIGIISAAIIALATIGSVAVSAIIKPNNFKPEIEKAFANSTGYKLKINGDIAINILPLPKAYITDVTISNGASQLAGIKQINVYPQILPLLSGKKKISSILVESPEITLEKGETGSNWQKPESLQAPAPQADSGSKKPLNLSVDSIEIADGKFQYIDKTSGAKHIIDEINIDASLASASGPLNLNGDVRYNDLPLKIKASANNFANPQIFADISGADTTIKYNGGKTGGKLTLSSVDLTPILTAAAVKNKALSGQKVSFDGDVKYENKIINLSNAQFGIGGTSGKVDMAAQLGDEIAATIDLKLAKLNLDEILAKKKAADDKSEDEKDDPSQSKKSKLRAEITASANQVIYKAANYQNLKLGTSIDGDNITLHPFSIQTPGGGSVETLGVLTKTSRGWNYDGSLAVAATSAKQMIEGFTGKKLNTNPKGLGKINLQGTINAAVGDVSTINLSSLKLALDQSNIAGALSVNTAKPTAISFKGSIDRINLNNYSNAKPAADAGTSGGLKNNKKLNFDWLKNLPVNADINATIGQLTNGDKNYSSIRINGTAKPNELKFSEFSAITQNFGIGAVVKLNVAGARPQFNIDANIDSVKIADLTKTSNQAETSAAAARGGKWSEKVFNFSPLDQLDGTIKARINSVIGNKITFNNVSLNGKLNGGNVYIDDFNSNVFGGDINLKAQLKIAAVPSISGSFSADNIDVATAVNGLVTNWPISGRTSVNGNFSAAGVHQKAMIENLNGNSAINASNINVRGLDLASFAYNLANITDPLAVISLLKTASGKGKNSDMNSVGTISIEKGVMRTQGLQVQSDAAQGTVKGYLDLPKWYMDSDAKFNLAVSGSDKKSPAFGIHLFGSPDALTKEYDTKELEKFSAEKGILSQKKMDLLKPGGLENKLNEKLMKQLGIKPPVATAPATAPTTTPATTAPDAATPSATPPAATTTEAAPLTKKQQRQEMQKELLNQGLQQLFGH